MTIDKIKNTLREEKLAELKCRIRQLATDFNADVSFDYEAPPVDTLTFILRVDKVVRTYFIHVDEVDNLGLALCSVYKDAANFFDSRLADVKTRTRLIGEFEEKLYAANIKYELEYRPNDDCFVIMVGRKKS